MTDVSQTIDPETYHATRSVEALVPVVRVLFHADLDKIGYRTEPGLLTSSRVLFGRGAPVLWSSDGSRSMTGLGDPCISREQFTLTWRPEWMCFEVSPFAGARRPVGVVHLERERPTDTISIVEIQTSQRLPPRTLLAIGDRVLLWLDVCRPRVGAERYALLGESESLWVVRDAIGRLGEFQRPILIEGQTGTGKELVSRGLHDASPRTGPFKVVNCGAIPEQLVESVLFGHRKGAFTGADTHSEGLFAAANGGTLFLDEVGELPMMIQQKMLRVLQEGTIMPVGSIDERPVDVRVVAATNRDLEAEVRAGRFRSDLYYRLAGHILRLPTLQERFEDIPLLFAAFLAERGAEHTELQHLFRDADRFKPPIPMNFVLALLQASWPGNVRELQNVVEETARLNLRQKSFQHPTLQSSPLSTEGTPSLEPSASDLEAKAPLEDDSEDERSADDHQRHLATLSKQLNIARATLGKLFPPESLTGEIALESLLERVDTALVEHLERHDYKQARVAAELDVSRTTLHKLMRRLGIPRPKDLEPDDIERARSAHGGALDAMARALKVSRRGLMLRMTELGLA